MSFEEYEKESSPGDRVSTEEVLNLMRGAYPRTVEQLFGVSVAKTTFEQLERVDALLSAQAAEEWARRSDPEDPNSEVKLNISEIAVYFGDVCASELRGRWHFARMPNYFESTVRVNSLELLVFDSVMKRMSTDFEGELLVEKFVAFRDETLRRAGARKMPEVH